LTSHNALAAILISYDRLFAPLKFISKMHFPCDFLLLLHESAGVLNELELVQKPTSLLYQFCTHIFLIFGRDSFRSRTKVLLYSWILHQKTKIWYRKRSLLEFRRKITNFCYFLDPRNLSKPRILWNYLDKLCRLRQLDHLNKIRIRGFIGLLWSTFFIRVTY